ncbi:hypothetical protein PsYK624_147790 [Phanerochaete sordida]|uniref:VPS9 domain-containing protein n=1 Tax=Phanerochaete sordida TaxID=48140 RepID=A0A9P3LLQ3_9APHY|nr:hypothetical protein PsYK624_147790 [Phanerochaete sordida]
MTTDAAHTPSDTHDALAQLHISSPVVAHEPEPNPWHDAPSPDPPTQHEPAHPRTLDDIAALDPTTAQGLAAEAHAAPASPPPSASADVLQEFDPLASHEEQAAKDAWETSESNPPPAPAPDAGPAPLDEAQQSKDLPPRPTSPLASFPSLAALARTFALPLTGTRPRPRSLDTATAVPSPATISSFAAQQQQQPGASPPSSGRSTPASGARRSPQDADALQFDFQRFLDQMKLKAAEPVAKYLRSFLSNFTKRTFTVNDQVKLINEFLNFISGKMRESEVWRNASDAEFDNAMEGMEKLVMNRLYDYTFTPQVVRMVPPRPVTSDDLERDRVLSQRIALFRWIEPHHLDIPDGPGFEGFLMFAQQELLKINHYKAPRDKLICILNSCKVIFGLIRHMHKEEGADSFIPILIYVVLKANPDHLLSNVEFINRFRNPAKLQSEAGYYLSSLMGAVSFIESMDHTSLSHITQEEFERNVEEAIQSLPPTAPQTPSPGTPLVESPHTPGSPSVPTLPAPASHTGEESAQPLTLPVPTQAFSEDARRLLQKTSDTISKPLSAIGRLLAEAEESLASLAPLDFTKDSDSPSGSRPQTPGSEGQHPAQQHAPYKPRVRRVPVPQLPNDWDGAPDESPGRPRPTPPSTNRSLAIGPSQQHLSRAQAPRIQSLVPELQTPGRTPTRTPLMSRSPSPHLDISGMQEEIDRVHESAASASRETLKQIFPSMDVEIMDLVLEANGGDLGRSIEALLEMSSGT